MLPMIANKLTLLAVLAIVSINTALAGDKWTVREDGIGPVKVGMSLSLLNALLHERFSMPGNSEDQGCFYVKPAKHPGIAFMIENGRLVRIDVITAGIPTADGIQVADSEGHALRVYGDRLKVGGHPYAGWEGHYLTVR